MSKPQDCGLGDSFSRHVPCVGVLTGPAVKVRPESQEGCSFSRDNFSWKNPAFPMDHGTLKQFDHIREREGFTLFGNEEDGRN